MARKLKVLLVLLALTGLAGAQPVEILLRPPHPDHLCPGCECERYDCFTPCCDCTLAPTEPWAQVMLQRIQALLVKGFGPRMQLSGPLRVRLVNPALLTKYGGDGVQGVYNDGVITISQLLTRREAVAVLAHEYGHAWQFANHPRVDDVDDALREGFAEWVALQALKRFGYGSGGEILRANRDPVYGGGLRWFLQVEQNFGVETVFEEAVTWLDTRGTRISAPALRKTEPIAVPAEEKTP